MTEKLSARDLLAGKALIGFDTSAPRQPAAMVGSPTVKTAPSRK